jgi:hypothetical protein
MRAPRKPVAEITFRLRRSPLYGRAGTYSLHLEIDGVWRRWRWVPSSGWKHLRSEDWMRTF